MSKFNSLNKANITTDTHYNNLSINTNEDKGLACRTYILNRYHAHLQDMICKHSKVLQVRFDLRYPADENIIPNREHISDFHYNFKRKLDRERIVGGHLIDPRFITVEEYHNSLHPHYHVVLLVNGNAKQKYYPLLQEAEHQWQQAIKSNQLGLVNHCDKNGGNGMMINRNSNDFIDQVNACSYQASYLAKERGKDKQAKGSWTILGTRVPKN